MNMVRDWFEIEPGNLVRQVVPMGLRGEVMPGEFYVQSVENDGTVILSSKETRETLRDSGTGAPKHFPRRGFAKIQETH